MTDIGPLGFTVNCVSYPNDVFQMTIMVDIKSQYICACYTSVSSFLTVTDDKGIRRTFGTSFKRVFVQTIRLLNIRPIIVFKDDKEDRRTMSSRISSYNSSSQSANCLLMYQLVVYQAVRKRAKKRSKEKEREDGRTFAMGSEPPYPQHL
jgi:hypothetical protein